MFVRAVLITADQTLWVGTDKGAGIFRNERFELIGTERNMAGPSVRQMFADLHYSAGAARGSLRRVLDESNPFVN